MNLCAQCESAAACHREKECILAWAERLAKDSVACGEAEYGPDYPSNQTQPHPKNGEGNKS